jgi:hypothetical protein
MLDNNLQTRPLSVFSGEGERLEMPAAREDSSYRGIKYFVELREMNG